MRSQQTGLTQSPSSSNNPKILDFTDYDCDNEQNQYQRPPRKLFDASQFKVVKVDEAKRGPEEGLSCLPQAGR